MKAIIIGYGFIGKDLVKSLNYKRNLVSKIDKEFKVVGISDSKGYIYNKDGLKLERVIQANNLFDIKKCDYVKASSVELIEDSNADLMVEVTPTHIKDGQPGLGFIRIALSKSIHVVTPNKGPLVVAYSELTNLADKNNCELLYEGTVAGAIPIFSLVSECLQGDKVLKISGILNGTTNYILSKMYFEETSFQLALKEAKERGISERNSSYDVEGIDAACKVVILANSVMNRSIKFDDVEIEGIQGITQEAVSLAKKSNYAIKLVGTIDDTLEVAPKLIPINHPICVHGTLNAIHMKTDLAKELTLVGYGAGKQTVSAVLNDMFNVLKKRS